MPAQIRRLEYRCDSGGAGRQRGGPGVSAVLTLGRDEHLYALAVDGDDGLAGGLGGGSGSVAIDGGEVAVAVNRRLDGGELELHAAGGGGFGDPRERPRTPCVRSRSTVSSPKWPRSGCTSRGRMSDAVFGEIMRGYFETVAAEMNAVLDRTTLSAVFNEAHDCSAGIFILDGDDVSLIARAQAEPVHIYASLYRSGACAYHGDDLHTGDIVVVNDPYVYGTHSADWTIMKPVFHGGRPIFFPAVRGHINEHGCPDPSGVSPYFRDIWSENIRFMPLKLMRAASRSGRLGVVAGQQPTAGHDDR